MYDGKRACLCLDIGIGSVCSLCVGICSVHSN